MNTSTEVSPAGITLKNPVMTTGGTFGTGEEYSESVDLNKLGVVVTKGAAVVPWVGNPTPHLAEAPGGMLNAIGLQNPGVDVFPERDLPFLERSDIRVVVNVRGHSEEEHVEVVEWPHGAPVDSLELNISCPNVKEGDIAFGMQAKAVEHITRRVKKRAAQPLIAKLSSNATDITETTYTVEADGADVLSLINTLTGTKIDIMWRSFVLVNRTGGPLGPAVHPIVVRMVYDCTRVVKLPLVDMGGISTAADAIEMTPAGATVISVGTANFYNPCASEEVAAGIVVYLEQTGTEDIREFIGAAR